MYDYVKVIIEEFLYGFLIEWWYRGIGKLIMEKYVLDVYYIYVFVEGVVLIIEF